MNTLARELAMAFLENRPLKLKDTIVTMTEYVLGGTTIAKWDSSSLLVIFPQTNIKLVKDRVNPILEGYGCGISIESFQQRLYFVDNSDKQRSLREVEFEVWYLIKKDGFILRNY